MSAQRRGVLALIAACVIWGLSPLLYHILRDEAPLDVLAYRALWSLIFFAGVLVLRGQLARLWHALTNRQVLPRIALAAALVSVNWFGFIYAISVGRALEASLGYYIFPMVAVLIGRLAFTEHLRPTQAAAVALATIAVILLTYGLGVPPWIALALATTFGLYGLIKKRLDLGPVVSVTAEVALFAPFALLWIVLRGSIGVEQLATHALLALSGPLTALPLILFSYAAQRVRMSTAGIIQFLNPTLQFGCAVLVFGEAFTGWHGLAFALIWTAVALYAGNALYVDSRARRASAKAGTSAATPM